MQSTIDFDRHDEIVTVTISDDDEFTFKITSIDIGLFGSDYQ